MLSRAVLPRALAFLAVFALLASCSPQQRAASRQEDQPARPETQDRTVELPYAARTTGGPGFDFSEEIEVRVLTVTGTDPQFLSVYLLSVGPAEPVSLGDGTHFRIAFDLVKFTGDGEYQIRAGSPRELAQQVSPSPGSTAAPQDLDQSNVLVQFWTVEPAPGVQPQTFNHTLDPCPLEVSGEGMKGSLECPRITDDNGSVISISMSWG
jgi:hypothetical protein